MDDMNLMDRFQERGGSEDVNFREGSCCGNCLVRTKCGRGNMSASICISWNSCLWLMFVGCLSMC